MKTSCGIIPYKIEHGQTMFFLGHPGCVDGKDEGLWLFLKGTVEDGEECPETALREFREESGCALSGITEDDLIPLGAVRQNKYKTAVAYALPYPDIDPEKCTSNYYEDGTTREVDRYKWMTLEEVLSSTLKSHFTFYDQIDRMVKYELMEAEVDDEDLWAD